MIHKGTMRPGRLALCCALGLFLFLHSFPAFSGQLYMWTDKKGVTHVSDQPPKEDVELIDTMEYKEMKELDSRQEKYKSEIQEIKRKYDRKYEDLNLEMQRNKNIREQEYNERKSKLENDRREREIESAKKQYEFLKSREDKYRKYYHEAKNEEYREYWYNKTKEVDDARSKVMRLQNQK
jgi:hypothetical protein